MVAKASRSADSRARLRVLALSTLYPSPGAPSRGLFVRNRLNALSEQVLIDLIVPIRSVDFAGSLSKPKVLLTNGEVKPTYTKWHILPGLGTYAPRLLYQQLRQQVYKSAESNPPDLLDAQFGYPDGLVIERLADDLGLPFVVTIRGSEVLHAQNSTRRAMMESTLRKASAVVAVSPRLRAFAISMGTATERAYCIPNGVDHSIFCISDRESHRRQWSLLPSERLIVVAGNLIRLKGFHLIIEALGLLHANGHNVRLVVAGQGGYEPQYEAQLRKLPTKLGIQKYVQFPGCLNQMRLATLFGAADLVVLTSEREGWPNVIHEAMACGVPIVARDVGSIPDLLAEPAHGLIVHSGDPTQLAAAVASALSRRWDRTAISKWACSRSWPMVASEVVSVYKQILANVGG